MLALVAVAPASIRAQDTASTANLQVTAPGRLVQLVLRDGSTLIGRILEVSATTLRFSSALGETVVQRAAVTSARVADDRHDGEFWPEDPSRTRLLFAPTGRMMRSGETYLTDAYVFFPSVQRGVTDAFSLGAGFSLFPAVSPEEQIGYLTPKLGVYSSPSVNVAVGALIAGGKVLSDVAPVGIGYGVATFGGEDGSITAGAGFGFTRGGTSSSALLMIGGTSRVSKSIALVTENYFASGTDSGGIFSGGARFIGEHLSVDLALWGGSSVHVVVPYLAFIYRW